MNEITELMLFIIGILIVSDCIMRANLTRIKRKTANLSSQQLYKQMSKALVMSAPVVNLFADIVAHAEAASYKDQSITVALDDIQRRAVYDASVAMNNLNIEEIN